MALRASYFGVKRNIREELSQLDGINLKQINDNVNELMDEVAHAGKNMLPVSITEMKIINSSGSWADNVYTKNGVTFTINNDESIDVDASNTTATGNFTLNIKKYAKNAGGAPYVNKSVILTGCPSGGSENTIYLRFSYYDDTHAAIDTGDGVTFTPTANTAQDQYVQIFIKQGYNGTAKFYPMIRYANIADSTFYPFLLSIADITAKVIDLESSVDKQKTAINAIIAAASAESYAAFAEALQAITPVTRSAPASDTRFIPEEDPEPEAEVKTTKRTTKKTVKEGE